MKTQLINGKEVSFTIKEEIKEEINRLKTEKKTVPGLAVILVGDDQASQIYVRNKKKACEYVGIKSFQYNLHRDTSQEKLIQLVQDLNKNPGVNGILVQLPLPEHINKRVIIETIFPSKDVDGFHPQNIGSLVSNTCSLVSCTPSGIIELLNRYKIRIEGTNAAIVGRSDIVGKPVAFLLLHRNATVTICHSKTKNIAEVTKKADIVIAAVGKAKFITANMVKHGAVVIDVGINRENNRLVGDVDFNEVAEKASFITPVPGGVGPMTIAMLLKNTLIAYKNEHR